ncbi:phage tail assembly chaperone [Burkholderia perseverans]|uniref:phage tail assembly chaperone n=1 Tax=Burkholderia perseverans TaxID=2615214 RepID=UPI001FEEB42D|nr:phage tail assembly chaperone [Burkholderia perseverans]
MTTQDIRAALLQPLAGFRQEPATLAGQAVIVREPSAGDWQFYRDTTREWAGLAADASTEAATEALKGVPGVDAALFVRVIVDSAGERVFQDDDAIVLRDQFGPEFTRLVARSVALAGLGSPTPVADAKNVSPETLAGAS